MNPGHTGVNLVSPGSSAALKFLVTEPLGLSPVFNTDIPSYSLTVPADQASVYFIAVPVDRGVKITGDGEHLLTSDGSVFTISTVSEDGKDKKAYSIRVLRGLTGISKVNASDVRVYSENGLLNVVTPAAERIYIFSVDGQLVKTFVKPAGKMSVSLALPVGTLVLRGSSGWAGKAFVR